MTPSRTMCRMSKFARTRSASLGPASRPVAIPDDVDAPGIRKAHGIAQLPKHVYWSGPQRTFNLADRHDRALAYELVLAEGSEDDVRYFIDVDELIDLWPQLVLPRHVRQAWAAWLNQRRGISVAC
jgi:hypothetical protein